MNLRMMELMQDYVAKSRGRVDAGPDAQRDSRRVRMYLDVFPLPKDE